MYSKLVSFALIVVALVASNDLFLGAAPQVEGSRFLEHSGYADCIELSNDSTRVVLCSAAGGRVLEYSLDGRNSLYLDPKQNGWTWKGKGGIDPSGGRFDIGPEKIIPKHPKLWLGAWQGEITGPRTARLVSAEDAATGVQLIRDFRLDASSSKLLCTQTIRNVSDETKYWCHWSRTLALGGGICLIPLSEPSRFPTKYIMYGPGSTIDIAPKDPNIRVRDGFLEILGTPQHPKLGMDSHAGWFCYLTPNDLLFVKRYPTYPNRAYNEVAALTISIWYYRDIMCELEPIGPKEIIEPGGSESFTETWWLLPYAFPDEAGDVDTERISDIVQKRAQ